MSGPFAALALLVALAGCVATPKVAQPRDAAERLYLDGLQQLRSGNQIEAQQTFATLLKMPAYLGVTAAARLRLGDALFLQSKYTEAIEVYEGYLRRHEGGADVAYAAFRVAECHARSVPSDFWLLPPVHEMDLSSADKARYHLERFVRAHPTSRLVPRALKLRDELVDLELAQHRYVIGFYVERGEWIGVVYRSHDMMRRFPLRGHGRDDYARLARGYEALGWRKRARALHRAIAQRWPAAAAGVASKARAAALDAEMARLRAAGAADAEMPVDPPPAASVEPELIGAASADAG